MLAGDAVRSRRGREHLRPLDELLHHGARLSRHPRHTALCNASEQMLRKLSEHAPFPQSLLAANPRLSFPLLKAHWRGRSVMKQFFQCELSIYAMDAKGTPEAPAASARLCFRQTIIPGKKTAAYKHRIRRAIGNPDLVLHYTVDNDAGLRSEPAGEAWEAMETAIEIQFERAVIVPCLSPFITDGRFYAPLGRCVYRFSPFLVTGEEALNGECTVTDGSLQTAVQFFRSMLSV
ncbi:MAG: hypothetical protein RSG96_01975 [Clostridia bacterium]